MKIKKNTNYKAYSLKNLNEELLKRFYLPLFLPIISLNKTLWCGGQYIFGS